MSTSIKIDWGLVESEILSNDEQAKEKLLYKAFDGRGHLFMQRVFRDSMLGELFDHLALIRATEGQISVLKDSKGLIISRRRNIPQHIKDGLLYDVKIKIHDRVLAMGGDLTPIQ